MRFYYHRHGYKNGRELGFIFGPLQIRLARHQSAVWLNYRPIVNLLY